MDIETLPQMRAAPFNNERDIAGPTRASVSLRSAHEELVAIAVFVLAHSFVNCTTNCDRSLLEMPSTRKVMLDG